MQIFAIQPNLCTAASQGMCPNWLLYTDWLLFGALISCTYLSYYCWCFVVLYAILASLYVTMNFCLTLSTKIDLNKRILFKSFIFLCIPFHSFLIIFNNNGAHMFHVFYSVHLKSLKKKHGQENM